MKRTYEVRDRADKRAIREFLKREGQFLLPMLEFVEQTEVAIDEVIQVMGRATIEAVLEMSAEGVAGVKQAGRSRAEDDTVWYGRQGGVVYLSDRKVRVERPRLRRRGAGEGGEVEVPAYAAMRRPGAVADRRPASNSFSSAPTDCSKEARAAWTAFSRRATSASAASPVPASDDSAVAFGSLYD